MMKAYKIQDTIVAAHDEQEAIATWAKYFDEAPEDACPLKEVDPATFEVNYELDDGSWMPGPLMHLMPEKEPGVILDGEY
jgi:hypothetical protein